MDCALRSIIFPETIAIKPYVGTPEQAIDSFYEVKSQSNPDILYAEDYALMA